jgi:ribosomal protein S18 acetylase RimI-like enzyme
MAQQDSFKIDELVPARTEGCLDGLVDLLVDAVDDGASVGFLAPLGGDAARAYWRSVFADVEKGSLVLLVAREAGAVIGTVQLALAPQPNGSHRAEVRRLLVHRSARRRGVGRALMFELEAVARRLGRTLLVLNTRTGDPPEDLYRRLGYEVVGVIPAFARNPDGTMNTTTIMYRQL